MSDIEAKREQVRELVRRALQKKPEKPAPELEKPDAVTISGPGFDRDESAKSLLTEDDFRGLEAGAIVRVAEDSMLTPLAKDIVGEKNLTLLKKESRNQTLKVKVIGIGADHGGYAVKEQLKEYLKGLGLLVRDFGTNSTDAVDYPDFAHAVGEAVSTGRIQAGIVIDGAGIGSAMAAGKVKGVRPAACYNVALARNSREHNGANVLTLGTGQNTFEQIKEIAYAFLTHEITEPRHKLRVGKIDAIERQYKG